MLKLSQILVSRTAPAASRAAGLALCLLALTGCGQKGDLYHPSEASASRRATLPDTLTPEALKPATPASAP